VTTDKNALRETGRRAEVWPWRSVDNFHSTAPESSRIMRFVHRRNGNSEERMKDGVGVGVEGAEIGGVRATRKSGSVSSVPLGVNTAITGAAVAAAEGVGSETRKYDVLPRPPMTKRSDDVPRLSPSLPSSARVQVPSPNPNQPSPAAPQSQSEPKSKAAREVETP
jgi:hypothetical protein